MITRSMCGKIEKNKVAVKFLEEIQANQIEQLENAVDDMEIDADLDETKVRGYKWYSQDTYQRCIGLLQQEQQREGEPSLTKQKVLDKCIEGTLKKLKEEKLPLYKIFMLTILQ